ncbi:MAG: PfkB family carbohydrate kinase [Promethearchaeota archaeon]
MSHSEPSVDIFCFGNISIDTDQTPISRRTYTGGAIIQAAWTGFQLHHTLKILTKTALKDKYRLEAFPLPLEEIHWIESKNTTSICNEYFTADRERRNCTSKTQADPFKITDFPDIEAKLIMYNGLVAGEVFEDIFHFLAPQGKIVADAQGLVRHVLDSERMEFRECPFLKKILPLISYFKVDAAEAEFITHIQTHTKEGRIQAARQLLQWGATEIILTHHQELLIITEDQTVQVPFHNRSAIGRTGRGDTCTTAYVSERLTQDILPAARFAAATTSLKMENLGPFNHTRKEVLEVLQSCYS